MLPFARRVDLHNAGHSLLPCKPQHFQDAAPPDVPVLVFPTNHNCNFAVFAQRDIPDQNALIFDIVAITVRAQKIIHTVQQLYVVWRVPVIDLLADRQILIPR